MVAGSPFVLSVEGAHRHPRMEAARGDGVVEPALASPGLRPFCTHVGTFLLSGGSSDCSAGGCHPPGACGPRKSKPNAVARSQTAFSCSGSARVLPAAPWIMLRSPAARRYPCRGDGPNAADGDCSFARFADRRNFPEPLDVHAVGQPHDQGPAAIERPAFMELASPELLDPVANRQSKIGRRGARRLQECDIDSALPHHRHQFAPRLPFPGDVPGCDCDHSARQLDAD